MRYSDKPLVGLIKECEATLCAKNAHRLIDDDAIAERWTSILCSIESCPAGLQKYIGSMTVVSFRRVAVVQVQKVGIARKKGEFLYRDSTAGLGEAWQTRATWGASANQLPFLFFVRSCQSSGAQIAPTD
jgi:hypothetical protein